MSDQAEILDVAGVITINGTLIRNETVSHCAQCDHMNATLGRCGLKSKHRLCFPDKGPASTIYKQDETGSFHLVRVADIGRKLVKIHPMLAPIPDGMEVIALGWHFSLCVDPANDLISIIVNTTGEYEASYSNTPANLERARTTMEKLNMEYVEKKVIPGFSVKKCTCKGYKRDRGCPLHGGN